MSTKKSAKPKKAKVPASVVWFEIPADQMDRAKKFYTSLFGWKIKPIPGMADYWHIDTGGHDKSPDGGLTTRKHPRQPITNYVFVASVTATVARIKKLGGKICVEKTAVPEMGFFAVCEDTEGNVFAIWEMAHK